MCSIFKDVIEEIHKMADVSVLGWIAEGGHKIIEGKKNNIILFDIIENIDPVNGIDDDIYGMNKAWFHCNFEVDVQDPAKVSFVPTGYYIERVQSNGWAWVKKTGGTGLDSIAKDMALYGEQVADYLQEGQSVYVKGREFLLDGSDGNLLRMIDVTEIWFDPIWATEKPRLLTVPYKSEIYITKTYPKASENNYKA